MEKQKLASVLFLVSGLLIVANAVLLYLFISAAEHAVQSHQLVLNSTQIALLSKAGPAIFALPIVGIFSGLVLLLAAYMVSKGKNVKMWAYLGIIFSLISIAGNGGFIFGFLIGIAAGVVALMK
ncbi:MAG: hypothetical protein ACP5GD_03895 [Candidatus Micrarchaeia archaeon]